MRNFVMGFICGAMALYGSMSFHVVRAEDGHHVIAKTGLTFRDTYVDIRPFGIAEWRDHIPLADALNKAGKKEIVQGAAEHAVRNTFDGIFHRDAQK